jgi:glycosyltransferase A (GT-A) superfamily protein (DUF2064 family)
MGHGYGVKDTLKILREKNYKAHLLPELRDVDTIEDLKALYERNKDTAFANSRTMKFISNNLKKIIPALEKAG